MRDATEHDDTDRMLDLVAAEAMEERATTGRTTDELLVLHETLWQAVNALDATWAEVEQAALRQSVDGIKGEGLRSTLDAFADARARAAQINEARAALVRARDFIDVSWEAAERAARSTEIAS